MQAVEKQIYPYLDDIVKLVQVGLTPKPRRPICLKALTCLSMLSRAVGPRLLPYMNDLLGRWDHHHHRMIMLLTIMDQSKLSVLVFVQR